LSTDTLYTQGIPRLYYPVPYIHKCTRRKNTWNTSSELVIIIAVNIECIVYLPSCILKSITTDPFAIETGMVLTKQTYIVQNRGSSQTTCTTHLRYPFMQRVTNYMRCATGLMWGKTVIISKRHFP
jgi:hypothetical protein